jgi:hypothetical protein
VIKLGMEKFFGKYRGFSPSDESSVGMGEIEMTIGSESVVIRMATGLKIHEETIAISEFQVVEPEETFKNLTGKGSLDSVFVKNIAGELRHKSEVPTLIFVRELEGGIDYVLIAGTMGDLLGPTFLFSQVQIEKGSFDRVLAELEENYGKDQFPRLSNNGKAKS